MLFISISEKVNKTGLNELKFKPSEPKPIEDDGLYILGYEKGKSDAEAEQKAMCESCIHKVSADDIKQIRADMLKEIEEAMYTQCFERNNGEDMQKWDGGNWIRYKLFENVLEQIKESEK